MFSQWCKLILDAERRLHEQGKKYADINDLDMFVGQSAFLGPNLWDKTLPLDDFKLEYMDLDEFLSENGIQEAEKLYQAQQQQVTAQRGLTTPPPPPPPTGVPSQERHPVLSHLLVPKNPEQMTPVLPHLAAAAKSPDTTATSALHMSKPSKFADATVTPASRPESISDKKEVVQQYLEQKNGPKSCASDVASCSTEEFSISPHDVPLVNIPEGQTKSFPENSLVKSKISKEGNEIKFEVPSSDLRLVNLAGDESFDPKKRIFTHEELRPQPMIKKSKKVFVQDGMKDDKYWSRRNKNNVAAKRSRDARRIKENQIAMRASFLELENNRLNMELEVMKKSNSELLDRLKKYEPGTVAS